MRFDWRYRAAALPFGITPGSAYVEVDGDRFVARFGRWVLETAVANIDAVEITGPYSLFATVGPAHVSLMDAGLTFATNRDCGVCVRFKEPVRGLEPFGVVRHPGLTVTVDDVHGLRRALEP